MCGIAGLWAPDLAPAEQRALVERMLGCMRHRGPDGVALWQGDGLTLGLTRLASVAPEEPTHVYASERGREHAVVNGEIYNHLELAARLAARGHTLEPGPDTVVVPHLYEEHGLEFPVHLDGMFAVALWDVTAQRLVLARDRAGEKPLFYTADEPRHRGRFAFASEPRALIGLPWIAREPWPGALARYLAHGFFADGDSAFAALRQLPPAHVLEWKHGAARLTRYWRAWDGLHTAPRMADDVLAEATRESVAQAVESRMPGDVPFGVFLSGGVDSGLVATLAARRGHRFPVFSMKLAGHGYDETVLAREVARQVGADYYEAAMGHADGEEAIESFAATMDQPLGDPSVLPTWALARLASRHVPVVLTGEGGDELFGGYPTYLGHRWSAVARRVPGPLAGAALAIARRLRPKDTHVSLAHLIERFLETRGMDPLERHLAWFGTATPAEARALLAPALRASLGADEERGYLREFAARVAEAAPPGWPARPGLLVWQLLDFDLYLGGGLLTKVDRCTMAHSVESRAPFLRHALIRFALGLPEDAKLRGGSGKRALKLAARGLLPRSILERRKQGFSPPFSAWARGPLRGLVESRLAPARLRAGGVLDPDAAARVLGDHVSGRAERGRTLWTLLSLQMWAEAWGRGKPCG
ncbi:MAG TPA: asparagine synthase (glutamine-hydrolyzing) [Terriglobales bacterium]|nr:asparagine synthase (glutamine-hydrolyzing) [Terriglobales bacterium]